MRTLLALFLWTLPAWGYQPVTKKFVETTFEVKTADGQAGAGTLPPQLIAVVQHKGMSPVLTRDFMTAIARERLRRKGLSLTNGKDGIPSEIAAKAWKEVLSPKVIIEASVQKATNPDLYDLALSFTFIDYEQKDALVFSPQVAWDRDLELRNLSRGEIEAKTAQFIRKEAGNFVEHYEKSAAKTPLVLQPTQVRGRVIPLPEPKAPPLATNEPAGQFYIGASAGTPTGVINGNIGIWGLRVVPLHLGFSGMYLGRQSWGMQGDIGYLFNRGGTFEHALGIVVAGLHETKTEVAQNPDGSSERVIIDSLKAFIGPSYTVRWKSFHLQTGFAYRPEDGVDSPTRLMIQFGFTPHFDL